MQSTTVYSFLLTLVFRPCKAPATRSDKMRSSNGPRENFGDLLQLSPNPDSYILNRTEPVDPLVLCHLENSGTKNRDAVDRLGSLSNQLQRHLPVELEKKVFQLKFFKKLKTKKYLENVSTKGFRRLSKFEIFNVKVKN